MAKDGKPALSTLEDPLVDRLAWRALAKGIGAVIARTARAAIDCNRSEEEIDPSVVEGSGHLRPSARARGGLGIVPGRTIQHGYLWRRPISRRELQERVELVHRPYHSAIEAALDTLVHQFGGAILIDCHSMPPPSSGCPPVVIGDCHGVTAAPWFTARALQLTRDAGFEARLNDPFAGGHIVARHGKPKHGVHAIQLEIDRRCYLDAEFTAPGREFDRMAILIERLAVGLGETLLDRLQPVAAE